MKQGLKLRPLKDIGSVSFLRGNGLSKAAIDQEGSYKCVLYGQLYTLYKTPVIKEIISRTNIDGKTLSQKGDVLVPGTTTADAFGIAIARSLNEEGVIVGSDINIIRTENKEIISDYVSYYLNGPAKLELASYATGTNIIHLSNKKIKNIKIPISSVGEQKQIVAKLDKCFEVIDKAKENAAKNLENAKELFQSKLNEIFNQKGDGWIEKKLGKITTITTGGTPRRSDEEYFKNGDIKWLVSGDVHLKEISNCNGRITKLGLDNSNAKYLPKNSVLIALNGQGKTRGTVALLKTKATCNQSLAAISPNDENEIKSEYIFTNLDARYQEIRKITSDDDKDRRGLNKTLIGEIDISFPIDILQQESIIIKIQILRKQTQSLEAKYQQELNLLDELKKSILQKTFKIS